MTRVTYFWHRECHVPSSTRVLEWPGIPFTVPKRGVPAGGTNPNRLPK